MQFCVVARAFLDRPCRLLCSDGFTCVLCCFLRLHSCSAVLCWSSREQPCALRNAPARGKELSLFNIELASSLPSPQENLFFFIPILTYCDPRLSNEYCTLQLALAHSSHRRLSSPRQSSQPQRERVLTEAPIAARVKAEKRHGHRHLTTYIEHVALGPTYQQDSGESRGSRVPAYQTHRNRPFSLRLVPPPRNFFLSIFRIPPPIPTLLESEASPPQPQSSKR